MFSFVMGFTVGNEKITHTKMVHRIHVQFIAAPRMPSPI